MHGSLPWQGRQGDGRESFVQKKKQNVLVDVIDKGLPEEFEHLLKYARALKFGLTMATFANYFVTSIKMQERVWSLSPPVSLTISLIPTRICQELKSLIPVS
jgi:hypothetical protein